MATITTKYSEGETVYFATTIMERKQHDCPDCLNEKKWQVTSPAGTEYFFSCPRCTASYMSNNYASLGYQAHAPRVERRTIGSVSVNTAPGVYNEGASYMCFETGIGSGTVYPEAKLFETEVEAWRAATLEAGTLNVSTPHIAKQYGDSLKVSDYQLHNAALSRAAHERSYASSLLYNLKELQNAIIEAETLEEAQELFTEYMKKQWASDKIEAAKDN